MSFRQDHSTLSNLIYYKTESLFRKLSKLPVCDAPSIKPVLVNDFMKMYNSIFQIWKLFNSLSQLEQFAPVTAPPELRVLQQTQPSLQRINWEKNKEEEIDSGQTIRNKGVKQYKFEVK